MRKEQKSKDKTHDSPAAGDRRRSGSVASQSPQCLRALELEGALTARSHSRPVSTLGDVGRSPCVASVLLRLLPPPSASGARVPTTPKISVALDAVRFLIRHVRLDTARRPLQKLSRRVDGGRGHTVHNPMTLSATQRSCRHKPAEEHVRDEIRAGAPHRLQRGRQLEVSPRRSWVLWWRRARRAIMGRCLTRGGGMRGVAGRQPPVLAVVLVLIGMADAVVLVVPTEV